MVNRVIGGNNDKRAEFSNGKLGRPISIPSNWGVVRVGIRIDMTNTGANLAGPQLNLGLGHGTTNMIGDATTDHFVGLQVIDQWDYFAGPPHHYNQHFGNRTYATKRVGVTLTQTTSLVTFQAIGCGAALGEANRTALMLTITKGSPNYQLQVLWCTSASADLSKTIFDTQMIAPTPTITNHATGAAASLAVNEAVDGTLDTVQVYWSYATALFEVSDLAVAVLS